MHQSFFPCTKVQRIPFTILNNEALQHNIKAWFLVTEVLKGTKFNNIKLSEKRGNHPSLTSVATQKVLKFY